MVQRRPKKNPTIKRCLQRKRRSFEASKKIKKDKKIAIIEDRKEVDKQIDEYYNKLEEINKAEALKRKQHQIKYFIK